MCMLFIDKAAIRLTRFGKPVHVRIALFNYS